MTTILIMLLIFAPGAFGAIFMGIMVVLLLLMAIPIFLLFRLRRTSRHIREEAHRTTNSQQFYGRQREKQEGEVKVYTTSETPEKRVSDNVGDYIDFEEVKDKK